MTLTGKLSVAGSLIALMICGYATRAAAMEPHPGMRAVAIGDAADWFTPDDYPPAAQRAGREGRVLVDLRIDTRGRVVSCDIEVSSGTTSLDERTCELAMARALYDPATDDAGLPVASMVRLPVRWKIPEGVPPKPVELSDKGYARVAEIETIVDEKGTIVSCRTILRPQDNDDPCRSSVAGLNTGAIFTKNGKPVRARYHQRLSISAEAIETSP